jgi:hypothetical protein
MIIKYRFGSTGIDVLTLKTLNANMFIAIGMSFEPICRDLSLLTNRQGLNPPNGCPTSWQRSVVTISETGAPQCDANDRGLQALTSASVPV